MVDDRRVAELGGHDPAQPRDPKVDGGVDGDAVTMPVRQRVELSAGRERRRTPITGEQRDRVAREMFAHTVSYPGGITEQWRALGPWERFHWQRGAVNVCRMLGMRAPDPERPAADIDPSWRGRPQPLIMISPDGSQAIDPGTGAIYADHAPPRSWWRGVVDAFTGRAP